MLVSVFVSSVLGLLTQDSVPLGHYVGFHRSNRDYSGLVPVSMTFHPQTTLDIYVPTVGWSCFDQVYDLADNVIEFPVKQMGDACLAKLQKLWKAQDFIVSIVYDGK